MTSPQLHQLYDRHAQAMFSCALMLLRDEGDARDVLHDVFLRLASRGMAGVNHERGWLLRAVHHASVDLMRRTSVRRRHAEPPPMFATSEDPDTSAVRAALTAALDTLPAEQRAVVYLKLWEGLTFERIAALLDIPLNTAASRYRYALDRLRTQLRPLYLELT